MAKLPAIIIPPIYNLIIADLCVFTSPLLIANQANPQPKQHMKKIDLSEADIKEKFITPAITNAGLLFCCHVASA